MVKRPHLIIINQFRCPSCGTFHSDQSIQMTGRESCREREALIADAKVCSKCRLRVYDYEKEIFLKEA